MTTAETAALIAATLLGPLYQHGSPYNEEYMNLALADAWKLLSLAHKQAEET